jgi:hypothetical protein
VRFTRTHARAAVLATITAAVLAGATAAPASAAGHHARPDFSCGSCSIAEGTGFAVGATNIAAGNPVTQEATGRTMTWVPQTTYLGYTAGFWKFSNGNYMAANTSCSGITVKSSNTSDGVVWFMRDAGSGKWYVGNRYCDNAQTGTIVLAGDGTLHDQYFVRALPPPGGIYEKMFIG